MITIRSGGIWLAAALASFPNRNGAAGVAPPNPVIWMIDNVKQIGGSAPIVLGEPLAAAGGPGLCFNGVGDGLILPVDPIAGLKAFTIEVLIEPLAGGPAAQRFLHIEDGHGNRTRMEIRMEGDGRWCLDTFLLCGDTRLTLIDRSRLHPAGQWHWVALCCDGRRMDHFVNGVKELEGSVTFTPFAAGRISLGVRLNQEFWFKGMIREVRFHAAAVAPEDLQRIPWAGVARIKGRPGRDPTG